MNYKNALDLIGNTPIIKLKNEINHCEILIKLEYLNPTGSIKIRIVKEMIEDALKN